MKPNGKKQLIESLTVVIIDWIGANGPDANSVDSTDIGFIGNRTAELMATLAITALELNSEAQSTAVRDGYLSEH